MVLLDSNILIYSTDPRYENVREYLQTRPYGVSVITVIEALGYHRISAEESADLREVIDSGSVIELTAPIIGRAIELRQSRKIKLGDSIVAATALVGGWELVTRNVDDFTGIAGLIVVNPFDIGEAKQ